MKISDLTIGTRLALAFGILVVMSIASSLLALSKLSAIEQTMEDVVEDNNVKIALNHRMAGSAHAVSRIVRTIVLLEDRAAMDAEMVKLRQARERYDAAWAELQRSPASEAGLANRRRIAESRDTARPLNDKVLELAFANRDAEAVALLLDKANPEMTKWQEAIDANIAFQEEHNVEDHRQAAADYVHARNLLVAAASRACCWRWRWAG